MPPKNHEVERLLVERSFRFKSQKGSHRQFEHPKTGIKVTVPDKPGDEMRRGTLLGLLRSAGIEKPKGW